MNDKQPVADHEPVKTTPEPEQAPASTIDTQLTTLTDQIRADTTPQALERHLDAAAFAIKHAGDPAPLVARTQTLVDVAWRRLWDFHIEDVKGLGPARSSIVEIVGLVPGVTVGKLPPIDEVSRGAENRAEDALKGVEDELLRVQRDTVIYMIANFAWYAMRTSSNPRISRDGAWKTVEGLAKSTAGGVIGKGAEYVFANIIIGKLASFAVGTVFGFVVGELINDLLEYFTHAEQTKSETERRVAAFNAGTFLLTKAVPLIETIGPSPDIAAIRGQIRSLESDEDAANLAIALEAERGKLAAIPKRTDQAVGRAMLQTWMLENAGEDDRAAKKEHVSEVDWKSALVELNDGNENATSINQTPDLFVHQTRGHFARMGLDPTSVAAITAELEAAVVRDRTPEENAKATYRNVDDQAHHIHVQVADIVAFNNLIAEEGQHVPLTAIPSVVMNGIAGTLSIDLGLHNDSVYVDSWDYDVAVAGVGESPPIPMFLSTEENPFTHRHETPEQLYNGEDLNRLAINLTPD